MYRNFLKRLFDLTASVIGLIILSPVFLVVTVALFIANQGKPFFFQKRPGINGRIFSIIKFKTMNDRSDRQGNLLSDAERLTPAGAFVRKTSLDEIPQLINVIKGEMSLIGPRPLLPEYLNLYNDFQRRRNEVRPGITGWAQVNGRDDLPIPKKVEYDSYYLEKKSFFFDMKILYRTIRKVIRAEGVRH